MMRRYIDSSDSDDDSVYSFEESIDEDEKFPWHHHDDEFPSVPEDDLEFPSVPEDDLSHQEECFAQPI